MADDQARIVSVIGGARRTSRWRIAEDTSVLTLFGRCLLDLREAETEAGELWFSVVSVFATVEIIVPEGTIVQPSGMAFLGASSCEVPSAKQPGPLPTIEVDAITVFGSLRVHIGQRSRVGFFHRLFRRRRATEDAASSASPRHEVAGDEVVDELRMGDPLDDPLAAFDEPVAEPLAAFDEPVAEPVAPDARTEVDELDEVLDDVLGGGRDLLGPTGPGDDGGEPSDASTAGDSAGGEAATAGDSAGGEAADDGVPVTDDRSTRASA